MSYLRLLQLRRGWMHPDAGGGAGGTAGADGAGGAPAQTEPAPEGKPATFDEVLADKAMQAEFDRRTSKALETARSTWENEAKEREKEAARLAKLSAEERAREEDKKRAAAMDEREARLLKGEFVTDSTKALMAKDMPAEVSEFLELVDPKHYADEDARKKVVEAIERIHLAGVQAGVEKRLKGDVPKGGGGAADTATQAMRKAMGLPVS